MDKQLKNLESRVQELEAALKKLQSFEQEQYDNLSNTVDNNSRNTYQLASYALKQYQIMKYMITLLSKRLALEENEIAELWKISYEEAKKVNFESDILDDFKNNKDDSK